MYVLNLNVIEKINARVERTKIKVNNISTGYYIVAKNKFIILTCMRFKAK